MSIDTASERTKELEQKVRRLEYALECLLGFGHIGDCHPCESAMCVQSSRLRREMATWDERNR